MISFAYPYVYILVPLIIGIWYIFFREKFGYTPANPLMHQYLKNPISIKLLWVFRTIYITLLISIIAGVSYTRQTIQKSTIGQNISIIFDISLSMLAEDMYPNRIEVAKDVLESFIKTRSGDTINLIVFAGKPFVLVPFSSDIHGIGHIIGGLSPYIIRQELDGLSGTNIGDALLLASLEFAKSNNPHTSIVLITDGKANIGMNPIQVATELKQKNIRVFTIGIGSDNNTDLSYTDEYGKRKFFYDSDGNILKSDLDVKTLEIIANMTDGQFFTAKNSHELSGIFDMIQNQIPKKTRKKIITHNTNMTPLLLILSALYMFIDKRYIRYIRKKYHLGG